MIRPNHRARVAAIALALLTAAQVAAGIGLVGALGGLPWQDRVLDGVEHPTPLLALIDVLKLLAACAQLIVVPAVAAAATAPAARRATLMSGIAGAILIAASGLLGLFAVVVQDLSYGPLVGVLALSALGATGLFALVLLSFEAPRLRRWHAGVTLLFGLASLVALLVPLFAFVAALLGCIFWFGLAGRLRHR